MTRQNLPHILVTSFSIIIALASWRFLALGMPLSFPDMPGHVTQRPSAFLLHVSFGPLALALGALQVLPRLRAKYPRLHRYTGRAYGVSVVIAALSGMVIAASAEGGVWASAGFILLSVVWLFTTFNGIRFARAGDIAAHRRWMLRSFALTFAGVTLRLYLPGFFIAGFDYTQATPFLAWMCWVPNLMFIEWWIRRMPAMRAAPVLK